MALERKEKLLKLLKFRNLEESFCQSEIQTSKEVLLREGCGYDEAGSVNVGKTAKQIWLQPWEGNAATKVK